MTPIRIIELHKSHYVSPYIELWSSSIWIMDLINRIMDLINRIMEPHKSILGPQISNKWLWSFEIKGLCAIWHSIK